jgi:hypothetical protein
VPAHASKWQELVPEFLRDLMAQEADCFLDTARLGHSDDGGRDALVAHGELQGCSRERDTVLVT